MTAPLLIGSNIRNLNPYDLETFSNTEVIAIDQVEHCHQHQKLALLTLKLKGSSWRSRHSYQWLHS